MFYIAQCMLSEEWFPGKQLKPLDHQTLHLLRVQLTDLIEWKPAPYVHGRTRPLKKKVNKFQTSYVNQTLLVVTSASSTPVQGEKRNFSERFGTERLTENYLCESVFTDYYVYVED